jgi:hypothetical protein
MGVYFIKTIRCNYIGALLKLIYVVEDYEEFPTRVFMTFNSNMKQLRTCVSAEL